MSISGKLEQVCKRYRVLQTVIEDLRSITTSEEWQYDDFSKKGQELVQCLHTMMDRFYRESDRLHGDIYELEYALGIDDLEIEIQYSENREPWQIIQGGAR